MTAANVTTAQKQKDVANIQKTIDISNLKPGDKRFLLRAIALLASDVEEVKQRASALLQSHGVVDAPRRKLRDSVNRMYRKYGGDARVVSHVRR